MTIRGVLAAVAMIAATFISASVRAEGDSKPAPTYRAAAQPMPVTMPYQVPGIIPPSIPPQYSLPPAGASYPVSGTGTSVQNGPPVGVYYQPADPLVTPPMSCPQPSPTIAPPATITSEQLKAKIQRLKEEELQLIDLLHKQQVMEIEQLKKQEATHAKEATKCRIKRENLEKEMKQGTPGAKKTCDQPQHGCIDPEVQKHVFSFIIGFSQ
jgi:hypothetical protein